MLLGIGHKAGEFGIHRVGDLGRGPAVGAAEGVGQTLLTEQPALEILRLGHAVGAEQQGTARRDRECTFVVILSPHDAHYGPPRHIRMHARQCSARPLTRGGKWPALAQLTRHLRVSTTP